MFQLELPFRCLCVIHVRHVYFLLKSTQSIKMNCKTTVQYAVPRHGCFCSPIDPIYVYIYVCVSTLRKREKNRVAGAGTLTGDLLFQGRQHASRRAEGRWSRQELGRVRVCNDLRRAATNIAGIRGNRPFFLFALDGGGG